MGLFLLPFAGVGIAALVAGVRGILTGNRQEGLLLGLFGLLFAGFAAGAWAMVRLGGRKAKEQEIVGSRYPDQPWLWRHDWASGRIDDTSRGTLWTSWIFAIFWNLISVPAGFVGVRAALLEGNTAGYVSLLFQIVGLGLLIWAVRSALRYQKYGVSRLELSTIPGQIGGSLAGAVRVTVLLRPAADFAISLTCTRRETSGSGKNSSTNETILWQEEGHAVGEASRDISSLGTRIPFTFRIPADVPGSDSADPSSQIVWRLRLAAGVPGVDYDAVFEVPVFHSPPGHPVGSEKNPMGDPDSVAPAPYRQPADSRITVSTNRRGTEIWFPAARNAAAAAGVTVFTLFWTAVLAGLVYSDAPALFPIVFGLFDLLLAAGALQLWLGVSRVTVDRQALLLEEGYVYTNRGCRITAGEIADITLKIGMQAGSRPYYDVVIVRADGKRVTAGRSVRDKREAEWLAATIINALGLTAAGARTRPLAGWGSQVSARHDG